MTNTKQDTEDYYICLDDRLDDKKVSDTFIHKMGEFILQTILS